LSAFWSQNRYPLLRNALWRICKASKAQVGIGDQGKVVMLARIYRPSKSSMQSGLANTVDWVLEFEPASARRTDPLMGWTSSSDMDGQVRLEFDSRDKAIAYAQAHRIPFQVIEPQDRKKIIKAYADNFAPGRKQPWTH
jgi:hypothetical protein